MGVGAWICRKSRDFRKVRLPELNQRLTLSERYDQSEPQNRRLGYGRVSTYWQTLDAQITQLRAEGCTKFTRRRQAARKLAGHLANAGRYGFILRGDCMLLI